MSAPTTDGLPDPHRPGGAIRRPAAHRAALVLAAGLAAAAIATTAAAQQRRLIGRVLDQNDKPVEGAQVTATSNEVSEGSFRVVEKTDHKGEFRVIVMGGAVATLNLKIEREGFRPVEAKNVPLPVRSATRMDFQMEDQALLDAQAKAAAAAEAADASVESHNAAVELAQAGDWTGAAAKFEAALAVREDMAATHAGLATASWNLKDYAKAEKHARRAIELDVAQPEIHKLLAEALAAQGKESEAASLDPEIRARMAYNRGADLANSGKSEEAYAAFVEALTANPALAEAHYQAGLSAYNLGKMTEAKGHLGKFLEMQPDGEKAKTAKTLLGTIK